MKKVILAAGLLLSALSTAATANGQYPQDGMTLPPAAPAPVPVRPMYWTSYFDTMFDDTIDVTAAANARSVEELTRSGWDRHHKVKDQPKDKS